MPKQYWPNTRIIGAEGPAEIYADRDAIPTAAVAGAGTVIYCSDPVCPEGDRWAVSDGSHWRRPAETIGVNYFGIPQVLPASALLMLLEGDTMNALADGASSGIWTDTSGQSNDADVMVGTGMVLRKNVVNGHSAMETAGAAALNTSTLAAALAGRTAMEMMIVYRHVGVQFNTVFLEWNVGDGQRNISYHVNGPNGRLDPRGTVMAGPPSMGTVPNFQPGKLDDDGTAYRRLDARFDIPADVRGQKWSEEPEVTSAADLAGSTGLVAAEMCIGHRLDGSFYYNGRWAMIAMWGALLTDPERRSARGYVEQTYGIPQD